jgi:hypothetical protein
MFNYKRKNNALNNAASGLERGLQTGIGLGMQARRQQQDEEQATFARDQALKQAKRAAAAIKKVKEAENEFGVWDSFKCK